MTEFQQICGKELVPVHRSYVINRNYISLIQRYEVVDAQMAVTNPDSGKEIQGDEGLSRQRCMVQKKENDYSFLLAGNSFQNYCRKIKGKV